MNYKALLDLGFSINEAKVYIALLSSGCARNGYEIAKTASVTRTMVYDILNRLVQKGYVEIIRGDQRLYAAVPYKQVVEEIRRQNDEKIKNFELTLERESKKVDDKRYIYNIDGAETAIRLLREQIAQAQSEIYLSIWAIEAEYIKEDLQNAFNRGVQIYSFSFSKLPYDFGVQYSYGFTWTNDKYFPRRRITAVIDKKILVMGEGNNAFEEVNIITSNTMLIGTAIDIMILDIWLLSMYKKEGLLTEDMTYDSYITANKRMRELYNIPAYVPQAPD